MLEIGHVGRAHGTNGEVRVVLTTDRADRLDPGSELTAGDRSVRVVSSRPHTNGWLVRFDGIGDRSDAERLTGRTLYAPVDDTPEGLWVHQIVGLEVVDAEGVSRGTIAAVQANPAHDLLELDDGTLVPSVFITEVGAAVIVDVPDGLFG